MNCWLWQGSSLKMQETCLWNLTSSWRWKLSTKIIWHWGIVESLKKLSGWKWFENIKFYPFCLSGFLTEKVQGTLLFLNWLKFSSIWDTALFKLRTLMTLSVNAVRTERMLIMGYLPECLLTTTLNQETTLFDFFHFCQIVLFCKAKDVCRKCVQ